MIAESITAALSMVAMGVVIPVSGWFSDKIGRKTILIPSALGFVVFAYPLFVALEKSFMVALFSQISLLFIMGFFFAPYPAALVELFPVTVRYSGLAVSHSISMAVFGGTAPFIATGLVHLTHNNAALGLYLAVASFISVISLFYMKDRFKEQII